MASEREAYAVQNRYLERFKQWLRVGDILRSMHCADAATAAAVEPSLRLAAPPAAAPGNHTAPAGAHGNAQGPR